jgi:hypothetical protein
MTRKKMGKIVNGLFLAWFICTPIFWHMDISTGSSNFYDIFTMAPYAIFHLVIFYTLGLFSIYLNKFSLYSLFLLSLYFPFIQLINYPFLTNRDVYLHGGPVRTLLENGELVCKENPLPQAWPASFDLHGIMSIVSGCDLINANYVLYLALIVIFTLILYSLVRTLESKGYRLAWVSAILFLCLFFNHLSNVFDHYSRTALAFTLLLFFFYSFIRFKSLHGLMLQMLIIASIVIAHPFQSFALVVFMLACLVLSRRAKLAPLVLFSIITFSEWFLLQTSTFSEIGYPLETFFSPQFTTSIVRSLTPAKALPWWGLMLRDFYKYSLITLLGVAVIAAFIILIKAKSNDITTNGMISLLFSAIAMLGLLFLPDWDIQRFTSFAAFPAALSSIILLEEVTKRGKIKLFRHSVKPTIKKSILVLLLVFTIGLSATVMVLRFERNFYFGEVTHPSELSSLSFFTTYNYNSTVNIVSWRTAIYFAYFNYNSSHQVSRLWYLEINELKGNLSKLLYAESALINQSQSVIRGMRDSYTLGLQDMDENPLDFIDNKVILPNFNLVYSNEYYLVYERALHNT